MFDSSAHANGNQSVVFAVTTSEPATVKAVKKSAHAQPTSLHPSSGRSPKIFDMYFSATYEGQNSQAFLPPPVDINSRETTNPVEQESFEGINGQFDNKRGMEKATLPNNKQDQSDIISFNGVSHNKIVDQYPQLRSLNTSLLDLIFGVSSYLILLHFLIQTIFSHLIWDIETQVRRHQNSIFGIFNVGAIGIITQDNGIGSSTLNSTINNILNIASANKTNIDSSSFIQSSKQTNADIAFYQSDDGNDDTNDCLSDSTPCQTINYILGLVPPSGYSKGTDKIIINMMSTTNMQNEVVIDSSRPLGNIVQIQSNRYTSGGTENIKQSIKTSSYSNSLFTITNIGHLQLLGLHFDNLKTTSPSAIVPLISIQSDDNEQIPYLLIIDCEFESDAPDSQIYHSIISINGGIMKMEKTTIKNYIFTNDRNIIIINSDQIDTSGTYRKNEIEICQSEFSNIQKLGTGKGAVINAQLQQDSILKVTDSCIFYNCSTQQFRDNRGGAINAVVDGSNSQFIVSDLVKFDKCQSYRGGAVSVELLNMGICVVNNVQIKECTVNYDGGGIFALYQNSGGTLTITNHTSFVQCVNTVYGGGGILIYSDESNSKCIISDNVTFEKCDAEWGGAICVYQNNGAKFEIHNVIFKECKAQYQGGVIYIDQSEGGSIDVHNVKFKECEAQSGGSIYIRGGDQWYAIGSGTTTISGSTFSGSKSVYEGGAIYTELYKDAALTIDNTQFNLCYSTDSDGGSIFALINSGSLSLNQVTFIGSSCTQPGSGGAIAIVQQNSNNRISITESSFTNCQTLSGGSSTQYGWGGAIYIDIWYNPPTLTAANFNLTDLTFTDCTAIENIGNNLHILSDDRTAVGNQIKTGSLLTVKDLIDLRNIISDLYVSPSYAYDYMGINYSKVGDGYAQFTDHEPLFEQFFISNVPNPSYIDASNGQDIKFCGGY
ncbi:MAG: hypothetical protein EZS28_021141 [Streblomastix strix]|uniref:Uncharacterized protein n=1 Tax=Streblomastix strix TaxID=222440 RepID=A0A5J4VL78_9EUKA|nr:MAG: hypothetical protein EZS28_021141 [Streblomastix strix]